MITLDCETYESTLTSICSLYNIGQHPAERFISGIDLGLEYKTKKINCNCADHLRYLFELVFGKPKREIERVAWFHLTRTSSESDFSEGILPLGKALPKIWDIFSRVVEGAAQNNIHHMQQNGVDDFQFNLKVSNAIHHGPYAMLVREVAFNASKVANHDYLEVPEIIEDICNGYESKFGDSIYNLLVSNLKKCIVKFDSSTVLGESLISPALLYLWCKIRAEDFSIYANTCFDSKGDTIPKSSIISIDFI